MPSSAAAPALASTLSLHDALPISLLRQPFGDHHLRRRVVEHDRAAERVGGLRDRERRGGRRGGGRRWGARISRRRAPVSLARPAVRSEEHTSELQSQFHLVCRLLLPRRRWPPLFPSTTLFRSLYFGNLSGIITYDGAWWSTIALPNESAVFAIESDAAGVVAAGGVGELGYLDAAHRYHSLVPQLDRKSTRLNSSHSSISYAVFCCRAGAGLHSFPPRRSSDLSTSATFRGSSPTTARGGARSRCRTSRRSSRSRATRRASWRRAALGSSDISTPRTGITRSSRS